MLNQFQYDDNVAEATGKKKCCVKEEGAVDQSTPT